MDAVLASVLGLVAAGLLGVAGVIGRHYEGRESRAVTSQGAVIDDLNAENVRLRRERDEARAERDRAKDLAYIAADRRRAAP